MNERHLTLLLAFSLTIFAQDKPPKKPGVKTPGVQIPMALLKPDAVLEVPGSLN
jgi:hypothetical protein